MASRATSGAARRQAYRLTKSWLSGAFRPHHDFGYSLRYMLYIAAASAARSRVLSHCWLPFAARAQLALFLLDATTALRRSAQDGAARVEEMTFH